MTALNSNSPLISNTPCYGCRPEPIIFPGTTPLTAALGYAVRKGWMVFPVPPNTKMSTESAENRQRP